MKISATVLVGFVFSLALASVCYAGSQFYKGQVNLINKTDGPLFYSISPESNAIATEDQWSMGDCIGLANDMSINLPWRGYSSGSGMDNNSLLIKFYHASGCNGMPTGELAFSVEKKGTQLILKTIKQTGDVLLTKQQAAPIKMNNNSNNAPASLTGNIVWQNTKHSKKT